MVEVVLQCEDSMEGILSGVFEAYALRIGHDRICLETESAFRNYRLFAAYQTVRTDMEKSEKVFRTIYRKFGENVCAQLCQAMISFDDGKADAVYHTIVAGLSGGFGDRLMEQLGDPDVCRVFQMSRNAGNEIHHIYGFLRFQELASGILLAVYRPKSDITAMIMPHFADRLPNEDFAVYDEGREYYAVHPKGRAWYLVRGKLPFDTEAAVYSKEEQEYQELFRHFCKTVAVKERDNPKLQRNMLPIYFRKYMTEF